MEFGIFARFTMLRYAAIAIAALIANVLAFSFIFSIDGLNVLPLVFMILVLDALLAGYLYLRWKRARALARGEEIPLGLTGNKSAPAYEFSLQRVALVTGLVAVALTALVTYVDVKKPEGVHDAVVVAAGTVVVTVMIEVSALMMAKCGSNNMRDCMWNLFARGGKKE